MRWKRRSAGKQDGCARYEQDLLLYLHQALPPHSRTRVESHLRRCTACRERLSRFTVVSQTLAGAVRGGDLPCWEAPHPSGRGNGSAMLGRRIPWYAPVLIVMLAGALSLLWLQVEGVAEVKMERSAPRGASLSYEEFREKVLTHNRNFSAPPPGLYCPSLQKKSGHFPTGK